MYKDKLRKYAQLAVNVGTNVQPGQILLINADPENAEFARLLAEEAYKAKAKRVVVKYGDQHLSRLDYLYRDIDDLTKVEPWILDEYNSYMDDNFARMSVYAPNPDILEDVDPEKVSKAMIERSSKLTRLKEYTMANKGQWTLISMPTVEWAEKVFPDYKGEEAYNKLLDAILFASRVDDNDPIENWEKHNNRLSDQNEKLNNYNFKSLHFKNSKGTDIEVGLVKDHIWCGGHEKAQNGHIFNPNIPTEESFTMPDKFNVNGKVYSTKPLNYNGNLIDEFWLEFKDGKVVDFKAQKGEEVLKNLLEADEGSSYIGEIALIPHDSPISNLNILFYNTLFDENASCHMALGSSYPMNIKGGMEATREELDARNSNYSIVHEDFMFGSEDMEIVGTTYDGKTVKVFEKGNFVI